MTGTKADIIAKLKREIMPLEPLKKTNPSVLDTRLGSLLHAFPDKSFPTGAVHEFLLSGPETASATSGFISGILSTLMQDTGVAIWISSYRSVFPPSLLSYGLLPHQFIFINCKKEKDMLWVMEEALKSKGLSAVIAEMNELHFTASRRLQLAVEKSRVTGFILRSNAMQLNTTASNTRWKITAIPSQLDDQMPGVGFPRWNIELLKVRNGSPGNWQLEFAAGRFRQISKIAVINPELKKKTG